MGNFYIDVGFLRQRFLDADFYLQGHMGPDGWGGLESLGCLLGFIHYRDNKSAQDVANPNVRNTLQTDLVDPHCLPVMVFKFANWFDRRTYDLCLRLGCSADRGYALEICFQTIHFRGQKG